VPRRGETVVVGGLAFTVMITRGGAVRWFRVARASDTPTVEGGDVD
jgi:magnesium and cobalt transporter